MTRTPARKAPVRLIGREAEMQVLRDALAAAGRGEPQIVVLEGVAGSGKTFMLHQLLDDGGASLHWGNTSDFANAEFGPVKDMLRRLRRESPERFDALQARHPVLAALLPELSNGVAPVPSRDAFFDGLAQLLLQLAEDAVTVLVFDDLHAADHATLELLARLHDLMSHEALLVVAVHRSDDLPRLHPLRRLHQQWRRTGGVIELELPALNQAQTSQLAAALLGAPPSPTLAAELLRWSGGLPLYVQELVETLIQRRAVQRTPRGLACALDNTMSVPESLRDAVMFRMAALEPATQRLLEQAAVMGSDIDLDLLAAAPGDAQRVEMLLEAGWLCDADPGQARFQHALLREAVYRQVPWTRRRQWHAQCASALEVRGRSLDDITEHWLAAREPERARVAMLARAQRACDIHAHADALGDVVRALELWPDGVDETGRLDALYRLGDCAHLSRRPDEAGRAWNELCDRAERSGDWARVARARRRLAVLWAMAGELERSVLERESACSAFLRAGRPREAALELCSAADSLGLMARWRGVLDLVARAWPLAVTDGDLVLQVLLQSQRGRTLARSGRVEEGLAETRAALDVAESNGLVSVIGLVYQRLADCHENGGDYASARDTFLRGAEWCVAHGQAMQREACRACVLPVLDQNGEWLLGLRLADEVVAAPQGPPWAKPFALAFGGQMQVMQGEFPSARPRLQQGLRAVRELGFRNAEAGTLRALALCDWFEGKPLSALALARDALKSWADGEDVHYIVPTACILSTLFAWGHDAAGVNACVHAASMAAQGTGQAEALAGLAYTMGESHLLAGRHAEAARELESALDLGRDLALPFARANTLRRLAEAQALLGQVSSASECLRSAIDLFDTLGAAPFLREATLRLRALAPLSITAADERREHAGLTPRQLQVIREVSRGLSDKEIARVLGLSPRTVEMHVGRLMATLRCRNRAEAVARASELRLLQA